MSVERSLFADGITRTDIETGIFRSRIFSGEHVLELSWFRDDAIEDTSSEWAISAVRRHIRFGSDHHLSSKGGLTGAPSWGVV